ncbi:MAG TPA: DOMON-like domain-containing protein [Gammaproteobacteria bacterium]
MSLQVLSRHPDTPCAAVERVEVELGRDERGALCLTYRMIGDAARIVAASPAARPQRRDGLWRHTCCELFLRDAAGTGYRELNFAPSGDWAAYRFSGYRAGAAPLDALAPRIEVRRSPAALALTATLPDLPYDELRATPRVGLACVIETATELSYWALAHAPGRPDFHHALAFALTPATAHAAQPGAGAP